jgi:hypothetical protein
MDTRLNLTTLEHFGTGRDAAEDARRIAGKRFEKALAGARRRRLVGRLLGRRSLAGSLDGQRLRRTIRGSNGVVLVPLTLIAGSESRGGDFDARFLPLKDHLQERWVGIAAARRLGIALPPVELVEDGGRYFVRDGHHRISVAMVMGQAEIEARIVN